MTQKTPNDVATIIRPMPSRTTWLGEVQPAYYAVERGHDVVGKYPTLLECHKNHSIDQQVSA